MKKAQETTIGIPTLLIILLIGIAVVAIFSFVSTGSIQDRIDDFFGVGESGIEHGLNPTPIADFSFSPESGKSPLEVGFVDESSSEAVYFQWDFDNDGTYDSTEQYPKHTYTEPGIYTVRLTASNEQGFADDEVKEEIIYVEVGPPKANFVASTYEGTAPLTVQFTDKSTNSPTYWEWYFDIGSVFDSNDKIDSDKQNPSHTYNTPGTYNILLTAYNPSGSNTITSSITVLPPPPVADFTFTPATGTIPQNVQFTDKSTSATSWCWDFNNDNAANICDSTIQNPIYKYQSSGTNSIKLTVSNSQGSNSKVSTSKVTIAEPLCKWIADSYVFFSDCSNFCELGTTGTTCTYIINDCENVDCKDANNDGKCEQPSSTFGGAARKCPYFQTKTSCEIYKTGSPSIQRCRWESCVGGDSSSLIHHDNVCESGTCWVKVTDCNLAGFGSAGADGKCGTPLSNPTGTHDGPYCGAIADQSSCTSSHVTGCTWKGNSY